MLQLQIIFLVILAAGAPMINGLNNNRKLQENTTTVSPTPDSEIKCGGCPCNNPCYSSPPPPPPPSPPPPPKKPPTPSQYCPPPPSQYSPPSYIYITGPPGNLYPVDPYYSGARRSFGVAPPLFAAVGFLGMLAFW